MLAILAILFAWVLGFLSQKLNIQIPWWFDAPSVFGFYGIIFTWFNKYGWKIKILHKIGVVKTPVIEGKWTGELKSITHESDESLQKISMEIKQTWTNIRFELKAKNSDSFSIEAGVVIDHAVNPIIYYHYQNQPKNNAPETMHVHFGSVQAKLVESNIIEAEYFSGRDRQNFGTFRLVKN